LVIKVILIRLSIFGGDTMGVAKRVAKEAMERIKKFEKMNPTFNAFEMKKFSKEVLTSDKSLQEKRTIMIQKANELNKALEGHSTCRSGCSNCCSQATLIYEFEAQRIADALGLKMNKLPYREQSEWLKAAAEWIGVECFFLIDKKCSIYNIRPMVCQTHNSFDLDIEKCKPPLITKVNQYDPDRLEQPYMLLNLQHNPKLIWGEIKEFFWKGDTK